MRTREQHLARKMRLQKLARSAPKARRPHLFIDHLEAAATAVTAVANGFIAHFTKTLWEISRSQLDHGRQVERAYVKMSHKAPGILFGSDWRVDISVDVKNFGRTPARITDVLLSTMIMGRN